MKSTPPTYARRQREMTSDIQDARPLIQAICLGLTLAVVLMVAAAMAQNDLEDQAQTSSPFSQTQPLPPGSAPHPAPAKSHGGI